MSLSEPLVLPESDMRGLQYMPLDVVRLMDSDLFALATGDEFKAAVALWCKCWLQVPAGSLPDDDRVLAHLSGSGSKWKRIRKMALRGFVKCSDDRLYHPVICEKVRDTWEMRLRKRTSGAIGNAKRWGSQQSGIGNPNSDPGSDPSAMPDGIARDLEGKGRKKGSVEPNGSTAANAAANDKATIAEDSKAILFSSGLEWLAKEEKKSPEKMRSLLGKMLKDIGGDAHASALLGIFRDAQRERKADPVAWIEAMIAGRGARAGPAGRSNGSASSTEKFLREERDEPFGCEEGVSGNVPMLQRWRG